MNLFPDLPESQPDELTQAKARFVAAREAMDAADAANEELGVAYPDAVVDELLAAKEALSDAEQADIAARKRMNG